MSSPLLNELIESLQILPSVGPKSAKRMAYHLLQSKRSGGERLSHALQAAMTGVNHCKLCRDFTEHELCGLCRDESRDDSILCVVESPADIAIIESAADFSGRYFVLMGQLSPLDGIGPEELGLDLLFERAASGSIKEVILALNTTVEAEATARFIADQLKSDTLSVSRIVSALPTANDLASARSNSLIHTFNNRHSL